MKSVPLNAFPRALARRAGAKKLRANGRIPAIIYGRQAQPQAIAPGDGLAVGVDSHGINP